MFKDKELERRVKVLEETVKFQTEQRTQLENAFNALFDVVAEDLGYEAKIGYLHYQFGSYGPTKLSPRQLEQTLPEAPKVIRNPTKRCK